MIVSLPLSRHNIHNRANKSEDGFERHVMTTKARYDPPVPAPAPAGLSVSRGLRTLVCTPRPHSLSPLTADTGTAWSQLECGCAPVKSLITPRVHDTHMSVMTLHCL